MNRSSPLALVLALALVACGSPSEDGPAAKDAWPELLAVPHPALSSAEAGARRALETQRRELERLRSERATAPRDLAQSFGRMASLYHAYDLPAAADACYQNARTLQGDEPRWPYLQGLLQAESGRLAEAEASFAAVLGLRPGDGAARIRRGEALLALGRSQEALGEFEAARAAGQAFEAAALFGIGKARSAMDQPRQARESFEAARRLAPDAGVLRYPLARALQRLGETAQAKAVLAGSSSGTVDFPDPLADELQDLAASSAALVARGGKALVAGRLAEAEELYRKAMAANPSNAEARRNLAVTLTRGGREAEAVEVLEAALRLDPDQGLIAFDLANARLATGDLEGAITSFERALETSPDLEAGHFNLANALMQAQRWGEAEEHLRRALELSPDNSQAGYLLAMARFQQGHRQEGLEGLQQVLARDPSMTAARRSLASILFQTGRLEEARQQAVALLEREEAPAPEKAAAYTQLAAISLRRSAAAEGESQLRKALEVLPGDEEASAALVNLLARQGRPSEARTVLEAWVQAHPESAQAQLLWAEARIAAGDFSEARRGLEAALARNPQDAPLAHALARLLATAPDPEARDGARALVLAQQAYLAERSLDRAETIAMAMAESGDFAEAVRWQTGLLKQAEGMKDSRLVQRIAVNLRLYEAATPVRSSAGGSGK